jgi:TPR repeat protein
MTDTHPILFVSHVSEDRAAALQIVDELERRGVSCWIAPRNVQPGHPFDDEIVSALDHCRAMLLIFSEHCNESEYIRREVTVAGENRKVIIPFRIEDVQPRRGLRVRLSDLHWIDGFVAREQAIDELVKRFGPSGAPTVDAPPKRPAPAERPQVVAPVLPSAPVSPPSPPPPQTAIAARPSTNYRAAIAVAAVLFGGGIGAGVWLWSGGTATNPATVPVALDALKEGKAAFDRKDYATAVRWDRQAADQGDATAQTYVGYFYEKGLGVPQNFGEAMTWYRKAADQGHGAAQRNIGNLYEQGAGTPRDYAEAMRWYRLAAEHGNPGAQTNIGYLYEQGLGVPQDYGEAMRWYRKAADQGEATAQNNIGVFYDKGYGVAQDYAEAVRWYRVAADQGNVDAEYNLALLYADGRGVPRDLAEARRWMQNAAAAGDPEAKKWLSNHGG